MITAKNYAAQAERGLKEYSEDLKSRGLFSDALKVKFLESQINKALHFSIPDNGFILDDGLKGIQNTDIRLPFPLITIEFYMAKEISLYAKELVEKIDKRYDAVRKNLIIAHDDPGNETIEFIYIRYFPKSSEWKPEPQINYIYKKTSDKGFAIDYEPYLNELIEKNNISLEETLRSPFDNNDYRPIALPILEFIEALSCKNVQPSTYQEASPKNDSRIKDGKLPIYETKILTINATGSKGESNKTGVKGSHASPRQHLRRGHIRRLETGNIWVNSCVVGDDSIGKIKKDYIVT